LKIVTIRAFLSMKVDLL